MEVTIHSVARKAQVSVSTASRILNGGTKGLRRDAVQRARQVLDAARELGYRPNTAARGLVMKRTFTLGFVATELNNPVRGKLIEVLRQTALDHGFHLLVAGVKPNEDVAPALENMIAQRVEGLILGNIQSAARAVLPAIAPPDLPVVGFGENPGMPWDSVTVDYAKMTELLTRHLCEVHRLRRIVFAGAAESHFRQEGYRNVMRQAGLEAEIEFWHTTEWSPAAGRELARARIAAGSRPEAIVCHNDLLAIGVIAGLRSRGLQVPRDLAVVGFDNLEMADFLNPSLTTVGFDGVELAEQLFALLHDRLEGNQTGGPRSIACNGQMFLRESCGCRKDNLATIAENDQITGEE